MQNNSITAKVSCAPELFLDGQTLTGVQREGGEIKQPVTITLPEGIHRIHHNAFRKWEALQRVCFHTPYSLDSGVFAGCEALTSVTLGEGLEKVPVDTFSGCHRLCTVQLPDTVRRINMDAFKNCYGLKEMSFPQSLEIIEMYAFWGCRSLEEIILPASVTELGDDAFASCTGLKKVHLPESLRTIGSYAFMNCINLEELVIPSGVRVLPMGVFAGCRNLKRIVLPETLEKIHPYAFYRCDALAQVEHPAVDKFADALAHTPFRRKHHPDAQPRTRVPMELLNEISGEVSGSMLCAMGYHWFEVEREYRIFLTKQPGVIEVRSRYQDEEDYRNDYWLMSEDLEPLPGIQPLLYLADGEKMLYEDFWETQLELAEAAAMQKGA